MINIPPIRPRTDIKTELLTDITKTWKVGQILNATVDKGGQPTDMIQLRIGQQVFETRTPFSLETGEHIELVVKQLAEQPLLNIKTQLSSREISIQLLRHYINNQQDIKPLINTVEKILTSPVELPEIKPQLQQFMAKIPDLMQASNSQQLKNLVQHSGVLLEPRLLNIKSQPQLQQLLTQDIKHQLLNIQQRLDNELPVNASHQQPEQQNTQLEKIITQYIKGELNIKQLGQFLFSRLPADRAQTLINQLQSTTPARTTEEPLFIALMQPLVSHIKQQPGSNSMIDVLVSFLLKRPMLNELKSSVDSLLNKIISQQLLPLTKDADAPQFLLFDLPVKHNGETTVFQFRIEEEKNSEKNRNSSWNVLINFEFEELGPIQAKIMLQENSLSTLFHAEKTGTASLISQHLPLLESALRTAGFNINQIDILQQRIQQPRNLPRDIHFLDEKA